MHHSAGTRLPGGGHPCTNRTNRSLIKVDDSVGIVTLNKEDRHNAFDQQLIDELTHALFSLDADPAVRVIVLSAAGKSFCAGADLNWMKRAITDTAQDNLHDAHAFARLMRTLNELSKPTIARVHGPAFGGGVGLIAACDIALATYDAQFALTEVKLGILPAVVAPLPDGRHRRAGQCRRYLLSAERFFRRRSLSHRPRAR